MTHHVKTLEHFRSLPRDTRERLLSRKHRIYTRDLLDFPNAQELLRILIDRNVLAHQIPRDKHDQEELHGQLVQMRKEVHLPWLAMLLWTPALDAAARLGDVEPGPQGPVPWMNVSVTLRDQKAAERRKWEAGDAFALGIAAFVQEEGLPPLD